MWRSSPLTITINRAALTLGLLLSIAYPPPFASGQAAGYHLAPVVDRDDIRPEHRIAASQLLALFPQCSASLKNFYVRYDRSSHRGLSSKSTIILDGTVPDAEFRALFLHEFGHVTDLGCLQGTAVRGPSMFRDGKEVMFHDDPSVAFYSISWVRETQRKRGSAPSDFVSGYAQSDTFEDFAESFVYFLLHRSSFEERAKKSAVLAKKLAWFRQHLSVTPLVIVQRGHAWDGRIPWDVTKIPYNWHAKVVAQEP